MRPGAVDGPEKARWRLILVGGILAISASEAAAQTAAPAGAPTSVEQLRDLSVEQLANLQVTSVAKQPEALGDAPAAIYVITHDEIIRSGATGVPEMLRLAPNLFVAQTSGSSYVISARGLSGNAADQAFADKLLVLIDGRTVYSPLFEGVYWDMQQVLPDDIDRIEVISGPGATLWGANAYSGVINIITKASSETQGGLAEVGGGSQERRAALRYGGKLGDNLTFRLYAQGFYDADTVTETGASAHDHWSDPQGGFRFDWTPGGADRVTLQGDASQGQEGQPGAPDQNVSARDLLARWTHAWQGDGSLQVQTYDDRVTRGTPGNGDFSVDTWDLDVQDSFAWGQRQQIVVGGGYRAADYRIVDAPSLLFWPNTGTLKLGDVFIQDTLTLTSTLKLTGGLKLEDDPYSGVTPLPDVRLSWTPMQGALLWGAVSQAIRSPTPFDTDVIEKSGGATFLTGDASFEPETLTAYEVGARAQPSARLSFSVSAYYNVYNDLRSIEPTPASFIPIHWGNGIQGYAYGLESWGDYQLAPWWRVSAGLNLLSEHLKFAQGASGLLGVAQAGDDPKRQAQLKSSMDLGRGVTLNADLRYVSALPDPHVPSYVEFDSSIAWAITRRVQLALSGFNLLQERHLEFPAPQADAVPRAVFAEIRLHF